MFRNYHPHASKAADNVRGSRRARRVLADGARQLGGLGLAVAGAGNISLREGDEILISRSGLRFPRADIKDFSTVNLETGATTGPRPSSETGMHLGLNRGGAGPAIVHYHGGYSTSLSTVIEELPTIHYSMHRLGGTVPVVDYHLFGSPELANAVCEAAAQGAKAAILRNHGAVVWAESIEEAMERVNLLEWCCEVFWRAQLIGTPRTLDVDELLLAASQSARIRYGS